MSPSAVFFLLEPDPENPGWQRYELSEPDRYSRGVLGPLLVRQDDDLICRVRLVPRELHLNSTGHVHGGLILGLADAALFPTLHLICGVPVSGSVTIDLHSQFIRIATASHPLEAVVEVLRETGRMAFLRGLVVQQEKTIATFSATVRKPSIKK